MMVGKNSFKNKIMTQMFYNNVVVKITTYILGQHICEYLTMHSNPII